MSIIVNELSSPNPQPPLYCPLNESQNRKEQHCEIIPHTTEIHKSIFILFLRSVLYSVPLINVHATHQL